MDWLRFLASLVDIAIWTGLFAVVTWLVAQTARRVLGVRIGWPRTVLVCGLSILVLIGVAGAVIDSLPADNGVSANLGAMALLGVMTLWSFALSATLLLVLEIVVPTGALPSLRGLVLGRSRRRARARRYREIVAVAARHGLSAPLRGLRQPRLDLDELAIALRKALQEAGVTAIKLGQMLSTRADLLPEPFVRELSHLTNRAEPEAWEGVRQVLEEDLGRPAGDVFASVEVEPLASASVAQVHAATLIDGRQVVVKVQRPGALAQVAQDLGILEQVARTLAHNTSWARTIGLRALVRGFAQSLDEELDYRVEIDNMAAVRAALAGREVRVPWTADELCSKRVIVMERFTGTPVAQASGLIAGLDPAVRTASAQRLLHAVLTQIISDGVFHADLHAGNVVIWPDGSVGLLDFGSVGRLDAVSRRTLGVLLWAVDADDPVAATDAVLDLLDRPEGLDERELQRSIGILITRFRGGLGTGGSLKVFSELLTLVIRHGFNVPPSIATALRSLGALEGTLHLIDPGLDLMDAARNAGREVIGDITPDRVKAELTQRAMHLLPLLEQLPRRINKISDDLESGRLTAHVRMISHPEDRSFVRGLVQQLVIALLAAAGILGGTVLAVAQGSPQVLPGIGVSQLIGSLLAFAGFVLALRAVALVFGRDLR